MHKNFGAEEWRHWIAERLFPNDISWQEELRKRFAIVDDVSFDHLAEFATEVNAHIAIDDKTGAVTDGALWYQEALPAESVLTLLLHAEKPRKPNSPLRSAAEVLAQIPSTSAVQFGGRATTGMGVARLVPIGGAQ